MTIESDLEFARLARGIEKQRPAAKEPKARENRFRLLCVLCVLSRQCPAGNPVSPVFASSAAAGRPLQLGMEFSATSGYFHVYPRVSAYLRVKQKNIFYLVVAGGHLIADYSRLWRASSQLILAQFGSRQLGSTQINSLK